MSHSLLHCAPFIRSIRVVDVLLTWTGEATGVSDVAMTSDQQQVPPAGPPRPTRRLTGLHGHTVLDQQRISQSSAATDSNFPEETSPGQLLLT